MGSYRASVGLQVRAQHQSIRGAVRHVDDRLRAAVAHPPMPIVSANRFRSFSGTESHQRVFAFVLALLFFGN